jgi:hypothetical protein
VIRVLKLTNVYCGGTATGDDVLVILNASIY